MSLHRDDWLKIILGLGAAAGGAFLLPGLGVGAAGAAIPAAEGAIAGGTAAAATGATAAATGATAAADAAPMLLEGADLAFPGSGLYGGMTPGTPMSFPGMASEPLTGAMTAKSGFGAGDAFRTAMMARNAFGQHRQQQPQMSSPHPRIPQQGASQSNTDIYKEWLRRTDPQTYMMLYGGMSA